MLKVAHLSGREEYGDLQVTHLFRQRGVKRLRVTHLSGRCEYGDLQ